MRAYQLELRLERDAELAAATEALRLYESIEDEPGISEACYWLTALASWLEDSQAGSAYARASCDHARLTGDPGVLGKALARQVSLLPPHEWPAALEETTNLLTKTGDYRQLQVAHNNCGGKALEEGRDAEALALYDQAYQFAQKRSTPWLTIRLLDNIAIANLLAGNSARAREASEEALGFVIKYRFRSSTESLLATFAGLAVIDGDLERAATLLGAARGMGFPHGDQRAESARMGRQYFASARETYGADAWQRCEAQGALLSFEEAISYAAETTELVTDPA